MLNVIGLGYIGLPTALIFAKSGVHTIGTDLNVQVVESLNNGVIPFEEKGIKELYNDAKKNKIMFSTEYQDEEVYIVAVPTPYNDKTKKIDPKYVEKAVSMILETSTKNPIIVIESTISPGTIDKVVKPLIQEHGLELGKDVHLAHAPERIIPGNMIFELENNSRTIGVEDKAIGAKLKNLYSTFCKGEIVITDIRSAEMSKVIENTYRDINIAFANELAKICREDDMDVYEIIRLANKHPRVNILQPGPGVGGHCISVDPWFLVGDYPDLTNLILTARKTNDEMPAFVIRRIKSIMDKQNIIDFNKVGLYGLTYKENVDDVRESPTLQLLDMLEKNLGPKLKVYDPHVKTKIVENQLFDFKEFINDIELLVVMVGHDHIKDRLASIKGKLILDTKNIIFFDDTYKL